MSAKTFFTLLGIALLAQLLVKLFTAKIPVRAKSVEPWENF